MSMFDDVKREIESAGEDATRSKWASGAWTDPRVAGFIKDWLSQKAGERASAAAAKRDAREEETLSIARKASNLAARAEVRADRANLIAWIAAAIAAASIIKDIVLSVFK